jgi:hypothetical protein
MEKKQPARSLEDLSHVFLSTSDRIPQGVKADESPPCERNDDDSFQAPDEMEETVSVRRRIAYRDREGVEENMRRAVSEHLRQGYRLKRVELQRKEDTGESKHRVRREEDITIFVKGGGREGLLFGHEKPPRLKPMKVAPSRGKTRGIPAKDNTVRRISLPVPHVGCH